jgi:hypothetical protein
VRGDVADDGVVGVLDAGVMEADVVGGPAGTELGALGGELIDLIWNRQIDPGL